MQTPKNENTPDTPLTQDMINAARYWLTGFQTRIGGRRGLIVATVLVAGFGLAFNWSWLVAAGFASVLIAVLPCVVMCGLGLCMAKGVGGSRTETKDTDTTSIRQLAPPARMAVDADSNIDDTNASLRVDDTAISNDDPAMTPDDSGALKDRN